MEAGVVLFSEPAIEDNLGQYCGGEPLRVEDFPAQGSVEAFVVSVFPDEIFLPTLDQPDTRLLVNPSSSGFVYGYDAPINGIPGRGAQEDGARTRT